MSKELDYQNLSKSDKEWLRARGWGSRIPGESKSDPEGGVVIDPEAKPEVQLAQVPNTGTATRPANHGVTVNPVNPEGYQEDDYKSWKVADLKAEIHERNEARDDDADKITPDGDKKDDLVNALLADDAAHDPGQE